MCIRDSVKTVPQKIAYRETIKGNSDVQGKHKKQSGGAGQYGDVHIRFSPVSYTHLDVYKRQILYRM